MYLFIYYLRENRMGFICCNEFTLKISFISFGFRNDKSVRCVSSLRHRVTFNLRGVIKMLSLLGNFMELY